MKILALNGKLPNYNSGLDKVLKIVSETLGELGVKVSEINVALRQIPYYDGIKSDSIESIAKEINESEGVIFCTSVSSYSTGAALNVLAEHLENVEHWKTLKDKNCMIILISESGGVKLAEDYYSELIKKCGGFLAVKICVNASNFLQEEADDDLKEIIEKQTEDYYRAVRQNRKYTYFNDTTTKTEKFLDNFEESIKKDKPKKDVSEIYQKLRLDEFNEEQERDINEITQFFAEKYSTQSKDLLIENTLPTERKIKNIFTEELISEETNIVPRVKTCKQLTASLPHHFQPQFASGVKEVIQIHISGSQEFDSHLTIENGECVYAEGKAQSPDITILSDEDTWTDVIKGKITAQKAFMVGQLKVRGNFVMLTKFEKLFNTKA